MHANGIVAVGTEMFSELYGFKGTSKTRLSLLLKTFLTRGLTRLTTRPRIAVIIIVNALVIVPEEVVIVIVVIIIGIIFLLLFLSSVVIVEIGVSIVSVLVSFLSSLLSLSSLSLDSLVSLLTMTFLSPSLLTWLESSGSNKP